MNLLQKTTEFEAEPSSFLNHWTSQPRKTQHHGLKTDGAIVCTWQCYRWFTANFWNAVGPCMDLSVRIQTIILRWITTDFEHFPWIRILFICWSRGLFLWMVQRKSRFRNLTRVDGTTQEFVAGTLRVCKFQSFLLAKYFILVNKCSCSHINFVQTAVEEKLILCCVLNSPLERRYSTWWILMSHEIGLHECWHTSTLCTTYSFAGRSRSRSCMVKVKLVIVGVFQATKTTHELVCL